ncbi:hypothetical protein [Flavobacterium humi]|uniref:Uncharacterized protein n=1 Tax=Flavobacterium humi TaxID=2562683 RepID=A0A4Z0L502_9FLAO|nr:hypothetical protein [Flavobacterium humi]TGD57561.1 hypothetical protein E4635_10240 [Flavobacterium humi]
MASGILFALLLLVVTLLFGWLGGTLGEKYQQRNGGEYLAESGCVLFAGIGLLIVLWAFSKLF